MNGGGHVVLAKISEIQPCQHNVGPSLIFFSNETLTLFLVAHQKPVANAKSIQHTSELRDHSLLSTLVILNTAHYSYILEEL